MSAHLRPGLNKEFLKYEYHVVYSPSYSVPVLYFTASKEGMSLSKLNELNSFFSLLRSRF